MNDLPLWVLLLSLFFLILVSGFFSGSETGLISLNRYRLRHLEKSNHKGAIRASRLLERTDRLFGIILLGNNFVNLLASALFTVIVSRIWGDPHILLTTLLLTAIVLIFAEVTPKTLAALHPERFAFPAAFILEPLLWLFYPLVWVINLFANGLLWLMRVKVNRKASEGLSSEELRTVVNEASAMIPQQHQEMLISILDLEKVTVDDIMVPRNEIVGIDIDDEWDNILRQLTSSQHTRLPVFRGGIDNVVGIIHVRNILHMVTGKQELNREEFIKQVREAYFVPEGTPLHTQLINFKYNKRRIGLVVDEYGDLQGLVTLEDILEEIVGEFTTDPAANNKDFHPQEDGSYLVDGSITIRDLNKLLNWELPTDGPKTLNGMILEYLETIPESGTSLMLTKYPIDIIQTTNNSVKKVRIVPLQEELDETA